MPDDQDRDSLTSAAPPPTANLPAARLGYLPAEVLAEIEDIARRNREAGSILLSMVSAAGGGIESGLSKLPASIRRRIDGITRMALERSYRLAARSKPKAGGAGAAAHRAAATLTGAIGGIGGLSTAMVEIPVTITVIFRALQQIAAENGFDPRDERTLAECLQVFASGGPLSFDDAINTSFIAARVTITGVTMQRLMARAATPLSVILTQKLAGQAVPVLGAAAGAGINFAFVGYYQEMARVRFGLRRLARDYDPALVAAAFAAAGPKRLL